MLIKRDSPVGIDVAIEALQDKLHDALVSTWGVASSSFKCHGRAYRNRTQDGYAAQVYESNREYQYAYWNDTLSAVCFFGLSDEIEISQTNTANVHLVFFVDLKKLKPSATDRADEEVRLDVLRLLDAGLYGSPVRSVVLGIEDVLREYPGSLRDERLKTVDMHPVHCFRINLELVYDNINCEPISNI